jgi:hypothetical protein
MCPSPAQYESISPYVETLQGAYLVRSGHCVYGSGSAESSRLRFSFVELGLLDAFSFPADLADCFFSFFVGEAGRNPWNF